MNGLHLVSFDLPPLWDGARVDWHRQLTTTAVFICPPPKAELCPGCRQPWQPEMWFGLRHPLEGEEFDSTRTKIGRWGRPVQLPTRVPAWPVYDLAAFRCLHCRHDEVWDRRSDEWWDLGPEDYGPGGSVPPVTEADNRLW